MKEMINNECQFIPLQNPAKRSKEGDFLTYFVKNYDCIIDDILFIFCTVTIPSCQSVISARWVIWRMKS